MKNFINKFTDFIKRTATIASRPKVLLVAAGVVIIGTAGFITYDYQKTIAEQANSDQQVSSLWGKIKSAASKVKKFVVKHTPSAIKQGVKNIKTVAHKISQAIHGSSSSKSSNSSGHSSGGGGSSGGSNGSNSKSKPSKSQQAQTTYNQKKNSANQAQQAAQRAARNAKTPLEKAIAKKLLIDAAKKKLSAERYGLTAAVLQEAQYNVKVKAALNKLKKASTDSQINLARAELNIVRSQYQGAQRNAANAKDKIAQAKDALAKVDSSYRSGILNAKLTLPGSQRAPAPLSRNGCTARGLTWSGNSCNQKKCTDGSAPVSGRYNYCSKNVTNIISKTDCQKLGRIWLSSNGCAHQTKGSAGGKACTDGTQTYVSTATVDYCTNNTKTDIASKKAITKTIKFVAPQVSLPYTATPGSVGAGSGKLIGGYKAGESGTIDCVAYVRFRLHKAGLPDVSTNGNLMVGALVGTKGYKHSNTPVAGSVVSWHDRNHTGIIEKVFPNGSIQVAHANWCKPHGCPETLSTFTASQVRAFRMDFAVPPAK